MRVLSTLSQTLRISGWEYRFNFQDKKRDPFKFCSDIESFRFEKVRA